MSMIPRESENGEEGAACCNRQGKEGQKETTSSRFQERGVHSPAIKRGDGPAVKVEGKIESTKKRKNNRKGTVDKSK